jgi:MFS family permease
VGVFLGAGIATLNARLISVGLPDLRGALGFGFDEASWIPTALNMATMFSGVFVVFLNVLYGPRRILLPAAGIFAITSALLPFAPKFWLMLALLVIAGLGITSGESPPRKIADGHRRFTIDTQPFDRACGRRVGVFFLMFSKMASVWGIFFCGLAFRTLRRRKPNRLSTFAIVLGAGTCAWVKPWARSAATAALAVKRV